MKNYRIAVAGLIGALLLGGCAATRDIGRFNDQFKIEPGRPPVGVKPTENGIFINADGNILVNYRAKSLLTVIDELAYKQGFNYTVLSDLTRFKVNLYNYVEQANDDLLAFPDDDPADASPYKQRKFADEIELLNEFQLQVNQFIQKREGNKSVYFHYRWVSDGPEFFLSKSPKNNIDQIVCTESNRPGDCNRMTFKKIFLKNITSDEAAKSICDLFPSEVELKRVTEQTAITPSVGGSGVGSGNMPSLTAPYSGPISDPNKAALLQYRPQNALIIRASEPKIYDRIAEIIPSLDANFQLVLVETQVYEYDDSIGKKIGAALSYSKENVNGDGNSSKFGFTTLFGQGITDALPTFFGNLNMVEKKASLLNKLAFFDQDGVVRVLAEPSLVLKSGEEAEVKLEQRKYFLTSGFNSPGDLKDLPTGIAFKVKPTVLGDNKILLNLYIRQSEFIPAAEANVAASTNHNEIRTSVVARDGELVSIGGILKKNDSKLSSGIPGMRKIPGLGLLFGSESQDTGIIRVEFMIRSTVNRSKEVLSDKLKKIKYTNCRINDWMDKKDPQCKTNNSLQSPAGLSKGNDLMPETP
ncbi:MAG: hypothetical protein WC091_22000 [Sulfuricellaceae bacterium]